MEARLALGSFRVLIKRKEGVPADYTIPHVPFPTVNPEAYNLLYRYWEGGVRDVNEGRRSSAMMILHLPPTRVMDLLETVRIIRGLMKEHLFSFPHLEAKISMMEVAIPRETFPLFCVASYVTRELEKKLVVCTEGNCSICLDAFVEPRPTVRLDCTHLFHHDCISKWAATGKNSCPLCRKSLDL